MLLVMTISETPRDSISAPLSMDQIHKEERWI